MKLIHSITAITIVFLSPGAALAVDYVKCEAMQNAASRLKVSSRQASNNAMRLDMRQQTAEQCGNDTYCSTYKEDHQRKIDAGNKAAQPYQERLIKVLADYEAEGCF